MKNKLIMKIKNNFDGFMLVAIISVALFLCNYIESEASPPPYDYRPQYIKGDYEVLNYFLDSLGINLPDNFPPELKEYVAEGVWLLGSLEKKAFKEKLREVFANITAKENNDKENKELFFLVFCEYMRNWWFYRNDFFSYEYKVVGWARKQGLTNGRIYYDDCSFLHDVVYRRIREEFIKEMNEEMNNKLKKNNNENDTLKSE